MFERTLPRNFENKNPETLYSWKSIRIMGKFWCSLSFEYLHIILVMYISEISVKMEFYYVLWVLMHCVVLRVQVPKKQILHPNVVLCYISELTMYKAPIWVEYRLHDNIYVHKWNAEMLHNVLRMFRLFRVVEISIAMQNESV